MNEIEIIRAAPADLDDILPLVADFHVEEEVESTPETRREAVAYALANPPVGEIWLARRDGALLAYLALAFGFSLAFNGRDSFLDEIYVVPEERGAGLGARLIEHVRADAASRGVKAMHLEVHPENERARALYERLGFELREYRLMSAFIAPET